MVRIDESFNRVLSGDPIAEVEKVFNKHHSQFNDDEGLMMLSYAFHTNKIKADYLKSLGDTHYGMKWDEFKRLIKNYGFKEGLLYDFQHDNVERTEEAILYYHPEKGLVLWATSYWNKESVNGGTVYGQVTLSEKVETEAIVNDWGGEYTSIKMTDELRDKFKCLNGCSHGTLNNINNGVEFHFDVREALINKLENIGSNLEFMRKWNNSQFLWFLDFTEDDVEGYDYKAITESKIKRCPEELQEIVKVCL